MISDRYIRGLTYNAIDSAATFQIYQAFWQDMLAQGHEPAYQQTIDLLGPLTFIMTRGIKVDISRLSEVSEATDKEIQAKQEELNRVAGRALNPLSPKQIFEYFYVEKRIPPYKDAEGKPTTNDKALTRLARGTSTRQGFREAKLIQELRGLHKLKGTYFDIAFDADGRFRTAANPRGTKFGRISTGKTIYDTGMNMQNLPPAFKTFLVADPGYLLIEMDKRQAEWVVVAYLSGDARMIEVLENNEDPHTHTAHLMFGADKELIKRENKIVGHTTDAVEIESLRRANCPEVFNLGFVPRIFSMRQGGKKSNHALNYDETYKMFAFINEMSEHESKVICDRYHAIYPGIKQWHGHIQTELRHNRTLTNCFGRRCMFLEKWGPDLFKQAYAFKPQSTVADLVNRALIRIYDDRDPRMYHVELLGQVHDSVLWQIPLSLSTDDIMFCVQRIEDYLNPTMEYAGREFHIHTDIKLGVTSWNDIEEADLADKNKLRSIIDGHQTTWRLANGIPGIHQGY